MALDTIFETDTQSPVDADRLYRHTLTIQKPSQDPDTPSANPFLGDIAFHATVQRRGKPHPVIVVFKGRKAEDFLEDPARKSLFDCDSLDVTITGTWHQRSYKNSRGKPLPEWEFVADSWC